MSKEETFQVKNKTFSYPKDGSTTRVENSENQRLRSSKVPIMTKQDGQNKPDGHFTPQLMMSS